MLRSLCTVIGKPISVLNERGQYIQILPAIENDMFDLEDHLQLGLITDYHYVSLRPIDKDLHCQTENTTNPTITVSNDDCVATQVQEDKVRQDHETDEPQSLNLPDFLKMKPWTKWCKTRDWLDMVQQKVVCKKYSAANSKGLGVSVSERGRLDLAFVSGVTAKTRKALLKKIDDHAKTASHMACVKIAEKSMKEHMIKSFDKAESLWMKINREKLHGTTKIFYIAYACAKYDLPLQHILN